MRTPRRGITIVEAMIAIGIFALISGAGIQAFQAANALSMRAADETKALWLAEEGLEASRFIRDTAFTGLTAGDKGLAIVGGRWQFSGTKDTTDGFERKISFAVLDADTFAATSSVSWSAKGATSTVSLPTRFTNWRKVVGTQGSNTTLNTTNARLSVGNNAILTGMNLVTTGVVGTTTITRMRVSWTPGTPSSIRLANIQSPIGTTVYASSQSSGTTVTLTTPIVMNGAASRPLQVQWNQSMVGKTITLVLTYSDLSTNTFTITNPPVGAP